MLFLIIFILTFASGFVFTWWVGAIIAFVAALITGKTAGRSFWAGFLAIALAWTLLALFKSIPNDHMLAGRVAVMLQLPGWIWVLVVTCLIGGLVGGMSALSGVLVKRAFKKAE